MDTKNSNEKPKKATFYIKKPALMTDLKYLAVKTNRDLSSLVTEAIEDIIKKYT